MENPDTRLPINNSLEELNKISPTETQTSSSRKHIQIRIIYHKIHHIKTLLRVY